MFFDDDRLQLAGPIAVIGAVAAAQASAYALATWPTCSLFWFLNLEVFRCFRDGFDGFAGHWLGPDGLAQSVWIAIPLVALTGTSLLLKFRLPLAIASHFSLLYSARLIYDIGVPGGSAVTSGFSLSLLWAPSNLVAMTIFLGSLLSSATSHRIYWRDILLSARKGGGAFVTYLPQRAL
jgi:hypothetical protein